jgi:NAD(P)H-dependent FMN reductase
LISILGLYGSLRVGSYNLALLRAMKLLAPNSIEFVIFDDIPVVNRLNEAIAWAGGIVIATPEYAGGIA